MKCIFIKTDGVGCKANAMTESEYCFSHNPTSKKAKEIAVKKGGFAPKPRKDAASLAPVPLRSVEDVLALIEQTVNLVRTEPMTHQKANSVGYLANITLKALEVGEMADRIKKVEEELSKLAK